MLKNKFQIDESLGKILFFLVLFINLFSIFMIYSASSPSALERFGDSFFFLKRHLFWFFTSYIALFVGYLLNLKKLQNLSIFLVFISIFFLILVLVPGIGTEVGGARRWLRIAGLGFQPSELAKIVFIIYLAGWLDRKHQIMNKNFSSLFTNLVLLGIGMLLIYKEPDLGTIVLMSLVFFLMFIVSGIDKKYIAFLFASGLSVGIYGIISTPYRVKRVLAFLDPFAHARDSGYQVVQSFLAIGNAGIFGKGIGGSTLKLLYLPEAHTDFILAIIIEELGIIGNTIVIFFYIFFIYIATRIILKTEIYFYRIMGFGLIMCIAFQAFINISVVTGLFPTKGIPLPFFSFGGTSLVMSMFSVGLILNIYKNTTRLVIK